MHPFRPGDCPPGAWPTKTGGIATNIYSVGHSTRSLEEFRSILKHYSIAILADVRRFPRSRKNPQFDQDRLQKELPKAGIRYVWLGGKLGGMRRGSEVDSTPTNWKSRGFQNYANYMQTAEFAQGLNELISLAGEATTAMMCAEALYWRCHRLLVSDELKRRGIEVIHIIELKHTYKHRNSWENKASQ